MIVQLAVIRSGRKAVLGVVASRTKLGLFARMDAGSNHKNVNIMQFVLPNMDMFRINGATQGHYQNSSDVGANVHEESLVSNKYYFNFFDCLFAYNIVFPPPTHSLIIITR